MRLPCFEAEAMRRTANDPPEAGGEAVATLSPRDLERTPAGSQLPNLAVISGIAAHDVYHAGQIQLLKRLAKS